MFWIQEAGNSNNEKYRLFYAEEIDDVKKLPTNKIKGSQSDADDSVNEKCALGSECFVIENSTVYVLSFLGWKEI